MERSSNRLRVLAFLLVLMFAGLTARLWYLQVLETDRFAQAATENSIRFEYTDALRGQVWDRNGDLLIDNQESLEIRVTRDQLGEDAERVVLRLAELLEVDPAEISADINSNRYYPFQAVPVAEFVDERVAYFIREHPAKFPGVSVLETSVRKYPEGRLAGHLFGYMGLITEEVLSQVKDDEYGPNDAIGLTGLEKQYEKFLRGERGIQKFIVNADGETIRPLDAIDPTPGNDLHLALDAGWQAIAEEQLEAGILAARGDTDSSEVRHLRATGGAVVILDADTGGIRAMATYPDYDPRWYVSGLTKEQLRYLGNSNTAPSLNRATFPYTPGSTFKAVTSLIVMHQGLGSRNGYYPCPAKYVHGIDEAHPFYNWNPIDQGFMSFNEAIEQSCDTFFYQFGSQYFQKYLDNQMSAKEQPLQRGIRGWGFGAPTGVDLPLESVGVVPDAEYAAAHPELFEEGRWQPFGDLLTMIGAGNIQVTPLQLASAYAAIANGGHLCRPHLVERIEDNDGKLVREPGTGCSNRLGYDQGDLAYVRQALANVVAHGTAACAFSGFPLSQVQVGGKTGTAERGTDRYQDTSWFAALVGPTQDPEYVVVTMVEQGGFGAQTAAPITRRIIEGIEGIPHGGGCGVVVEDQ